MFTGIWLSSYKCLCCVFTNGESSNTQSAKKFDFKAEFFLVPSGGQSRMAQNLDPSTGQDQPPGSQVVAVGTPLLTGALPGTAHQGSVMVRWGVTK